MQIDPSKLFKQESGLSGELELSTLPRFYDLVNNTNQELVSRSVVSIKQVDNATTKVNYTISCVLDAEERYCLTGTVYLKLNLLCNRCLLPLEQDLNVDFCLYPVNSEADIFGSLGEVEVIYLQQGMVDLEQLLEDELILAFPQFAKHALDDQACTSFKTKYAPIDDKPDNDAKIGRDNPFGQLVDLLKE